MINVNKITSTLAKLPDQQLQQYAQMHKSDPYIMALAMSESNRRKEMRAAGQGGQGMQEQPKVVDSEIARMGDMQGATPEQLARLAQMLDARKEAEYKEFTGQQSQQLPEDQGIGQLPAGEMNFAGGGIIAFADGGDVERYQSGGMSFIDRLTYGNITPAERARREKLQAEANAGRLLTPYEQERAANMATVTAGSTYTPEAYGVTKPAPLFADAQRSQALVPSADKTLKDDTERKDTGRKDTKRKDPSAKTDSVKPSVLDPKAMFATELEKTSKEVRPEKALLETLVADRKKADEEELTGLRGLNEKFADAFKSKRERLDTREGAIDKMKDQSMGLALLQAGARMMSTRGSVGEAIGAGIDTGTKQYVAGLDKINIAKDKLAEARDRLDELQLNRDEMSAREILKAESKIRQTALSGQETMINYVMERDKVDRETAMKIVDNQIKVSLEREGNVSRETVARISAAPALERNALLKLANNKDDKVRTEYGKLQAKVMDTLGKDPNYTMANPMQQQVLQTTALRQALMSNPFLAPYAAGIGFSSAPTGGKVYDLTED